MRFEDEQYVKVYKRDTATWKAMNWQGRAIISLLIRKADGAGLMETSSLGRVEGVSALIDMPPEVVAAGLDSLVRLKVVQWLKGDILLLPRYVEAQEARKTESAKKRGQRETARDAARAQESGILEDVSHDVPPRPAASQPVPLQIRSDQLISDQTSSDLSPSGGPASPEQAPLINDDPRKAAPEKKREPSEWQKIWAEWCEHRRARLFYLEVDPVDEEVSPALINAGLKRAFERCKQSHPDDVVEAADLLYVWLAYLHNDFGARTDPPYCLQMFLSENVLTRAVEDSVKTSTEDTREQLGLVTWALANGMELLT